MATITERLKWLIEADASSAIKGFEATGDAAEKNLKKAETSSQKVGGQLTKVGAGALAVSGIVGGALVKAAGSFEDLALKAGQMSDATGLSVDQASRWIEVSDDMGIGADTIETALGKMNKTLGASPQKFADLGVEIARTKTGAEDVNGTFINTISRLNEIEDPAKRAAGAASIFGKGWQGAAELLKLSTVDIKTQLASVSDQKVINEEELQKAKDYRHALDTLKDSAESLALAIGEGAAPVIGAIASAVGTAVQAFADLDGISHGAAGGILAVGAAGLGAVGALSVLAGQVIKMKGRFLEAEGGLTTFGKAAAGVGVATGIAGLAMIAYTGIASDNAKKKAALVAITNDFVDALKAEKKGQDGAVTSLIAKDLADKNIIENATKLGISTQNLADIITGKAVPAWDAMKDRAENLTGEFAGSVDPVKKNAVAFGELRAAVDPLKQGLVDAKEQIKLTGAVTKDLGVASDDAAASADNLTASTELEGQALLDASLNADLTRQANERAGKAEEAHKKSAEALAEAVTRGLDEMQRGWDQLTGDINNDETWINLQTSFDETKTKVTEAWKAAADGADDAEQKTRDAQLAVDDQKKAVIDYGKEVLGLPKEQVTKLLAEIDQGQLDLVEAQLAALTRNRTISLDIVAKGGAGYSKLPNFDSGGTVPGPRGAPTLAVVHGGEEVLTPGQQSSGGGGPINVTINMPVGSDGNDVVNAIRTFERRNGAGWRS